MRLILLTLIFLGSFLSTHAAEGKIVKVLPFFLDHAGQIAKSPSLFDRDAYQAYLRAHTNEVSGLRYDVQCKADEKLKLRLELRSTGTDSKPKIKTIESAVASGSFNNWTEVKFTGDDYKNFGAIVAWRATLWNGDKQLSEQKSFLW